MQKQRFELRFQINDETALLVRDFARSYLDFDEHSFGKENFSYPVHSVYLDSDELKLYRDIVDDEKTNHHKLRLRYYDSKPDAPVYCEIKREINRCIFKQRACVRHECVELLLKNHQPNPEHLASNEPNCLIGLQNFCHLARQIQAKPKVHIFHWREAYLSDDNQCRLTLDRKVVSDAHLDYSIPTDVKAPRLMFSGQVILELKFTNRFPDWFRELIRVFGIIEWEGEGGKYRDAVETIGL